MADFRRCIIAFAVVALLVGLVPTASAQVVSGVQCIANAAVPPTLRAEGLTELVGDIVLNCTGGTPTASGLQIPQANITIFLNTQVTSRLYSNNQSEAILTVDEPAAGNTSASQTCTSITGCAAFAAGAGAPNTTEFSSAFNISPGVSGSLGCTVGVGGCITNINKNVYEGTVNGNSVTFVGIPIDPPGTTGTRIYRITNVRANATIPAPGGSGTPGQIIALISATPAQASTGLTSTFAINNPTQIVGFVQASLSTSVTSGTGTSAISSSGISLQQCTGSGVGGSSRNSLFGQLNFKEVFPTAFKTRTIAGTGVTSQDTLGIVYNSESGYVNPRLASPLGTNGGGVANGESGLADFGTRLKAVFNNIPNGVNIFVAVNNTGATGTATPTNGLAATLTTSETGSFTPVSSTTTTVGGNTATLPPGGAFQVPITNGSGVAVWEVTAANPLSTDTYSFEYFVVASPSPATNSPAVGTGTVNLSYAPTPTAAFTASAGAVASSSLPIPRFIDTSTASNIVNVTLCRTNLLYPYVVANGVFDTGLAISNTSTDPFGTAAQQGPCTLNFFGSNAPAAVNTGNVASGTTYATVISSVAPNFQGYVIAVCNFQYAHGFAFVSDVGVRNFAAGYLALLIPDPPRSAFPFVCANSSIAGCTPSGEQLGY